MSSVSDHGNHAIESEVLLPLLPVRPPGRSHSSHSSVDTRLETIERRRTYPWKDIVSEQSLKQWATECEPVTRLTLTQARVRWDQLVGHAALAIFDGHVTIAVQHLQSAHAWKNRWEQARSELLPLTPEHWITLSACSTAVGDDDTAAAFAVHAWDSASRSWISDLQHDFRDSRADAATLLALNRLRQHRPDRAESLLECGINGHRQIGDVEQLTADWLLLSLCCEASGDLSRAEDARNAAAELLSESLDPERHPRHAKLNSWLHQHRQVGLLLRKGL